MTASVEDLFARLEPKSTATFAGVSAADQVSRSAATHNDVDAPMRGSDSPSQDSGVEVGRPASYSHQFFGMPPAGLVPSVYVLPETACAVCVPRTSLDHFGIPGITVERLMASQPLAEYRIALTSHCDFRSVALPDFSAALEHVRATQWDWRTLLGLAGAAADEELGTDDALLDLAYEESTYTARPRNLKVLKNIPVRVDPNATRAARVYGPEDAEGWVR